MCSSDTSQLGYLIDEGRKVKPFVQATYPLEQAARAEEQLEKQHSRGKIVLQVVG